MAAPVLTLVTDRPPTEIEIDGQRYALRHPDELSLTQSFQIERKQPRFIELMKRLHEDPDAVTADERAEVERLVPEILEVILDAPLEVREKLRDEQRLRVIKAFFELRRPENETAPADSKRSASRSPRGSRGSTAARR